MYSIAQFILFRELHQFPRIPLLKMEDPGKGDERLEAGLMRRLDSTRPRSGPCIVHFGSMPVPRKPDLDSARLFTKAIPDRAGQCRVVRCASPARPGFESGSS